MIWQEDLAREKARVAALSAEDLLTEMRAHARENELPGCDATYLMGLYADRFEALLLDSYEDNRDLRARDTERGV